MPTSQNESLMRAAFSPARTLEPSEADVARVIARVRSTSKRPASPALGDRQRLVAMGLAILALFAAGMYTVPATRAAIDDVAGAFGGWIGGDSADAPGRPLGANEQAPAYFHDGSWAREHVNEPRVIAEAGGYKLYAYLERTGTISFDLGDTGVGMGGYKASDFDGRALEVLGPGAMPQADGQGHVPLFGITARSVTSVELTYDSGPPLRVDGVDGGFVLLAEPSRGPHEVVAYGADDNAIGQQLVDSSPHSGPRIDWGQYGPAGER